MSHTISRKTLGWAVPATAASAALIAALSMGTFGAFSASITNDPNTAGAGTINMRQVALDESLSAEIPGTEITTVGTEGNAVTTETDLFGRNLEMNPGDIEQTIVNISHSGSLRANTFVIKPGEPVITPDAVDDGGTNLADVMTVTIEAYNGADGWTPVQEAIAISALTETIDAGVLPQGSQDEKGDPVWSEGITFRFTTTLSEDAPIGVMGASVSQPLTWTFDTATTDQG